MGAASFWEWKGGRVNVGLEVVIANLVLLAKTADMVCDIGPRTEAIDLCTLKEK
jgi:hypothetical protein